MVLPAMTRDKMEVLIEMMLNGEPPSLVMKMMLITICGKLSNTASRIRITETRGNF